MSRKFAKTVPSTDFKVKLAVSASVVASIGSCLVELLPHSFFVDRFKNIIQMYKQGEPLPLRDDLKNLFDSVVDDLKIDEKEKHKYDPFVMPGYNTYNAGMITNDRTKAIIGIPFTYTYKDKFSIDTTQIRLGVDKEILNIYHPAAEDLLDSIVLSDKAKKFGIAREILMSQKNLPLYRSLESPALIISSSCLVLFANSQYNLRNKPLLFKVMSYAFIAAAGFATWFQIRDTLNRYFETAVDKELAKLGPEYVEGGKEFYAKLLKRNVALRTLLGKVGQSQFNRDGDEVFFIRYRRTPLTYREKFFSEFNLSENQTQAA